MTPESPGGGHRDATVAEIAEKCGVELERVEPARVPVEQYREQGRVACRECGQVADPPFIVVARFEDEAPRCHECFARWLPIDEPEAEVMALAAAGWGVPELQQEFSPLGRHASDAPELLRRGARQLDGRL